jgi:hypothetical protein
MLIEKVLEEEVPFPTAMHLRVPKTLLDAITPS